MCKKAWASPPLGRQAFNIGGRFKFWATHGRAVRRAGLVESLTNIRAQEPASIWYQAAPGSALRR